ncbi:MAG TPA: DPP IV N-terminal domain-containing protein [Pyrinomonadaceae bacterium]|nr:DPP IV N-terminal domain-containing protein [Pyrinomonadaceae bacterium]HMP64391.1 DPP IV N-terminal domain-containing protein [Pyrinomonadaceae bacterium]
MKTSTSRFATLSVSLLFLLVPFVSNSGAQNVTAEDYVRAERMLGFRTASLIDRVGLRPIFLPDGRLWYQALTADGREFVLFDPATRTRSTAGSLKELGLGPPPPQFGRRGSGREVVSPDGKLSVFIRDWNLWLKDVETGKETQLTKDGIENFGYATDNAGWRKSDRPIVLWSPDSKKIATYQQDQRHVSDMYLVTTNVGAPRLEAWKYPLPQDERVIMIRRVIIDVENGRLTEIKVPPDPRRGTLCDDISCTGAFDDNEWSPDGRKLAFVSSSRDHKEAKFRVADAQTGEVREVFEEVVETQYESGRGEINWKYLPLTNEAIWYSQRDDWGHLYLYDLTTGRPKVQITRGDFVVTRVARVDVENRVIFFEANGREKGRVPYFSHFYRVNFDGSGLRLLTPEDGHHQLFLAPNGRYFVDSYSKPDVPPILAVRDMEGNLIETLERGDISRLAATGWKPPTPVTVKSRDGRWDLYGLMFTPSVLDEKRKYPVVNYIYPGPQAGGVGSRAFSAARSDHQALAELGFIVVVIDGTCNPGRSKSFHDSCYGDMADNTLEDQIAGIRELAKRYPYLDLDRVGIWGHSGGGFATAAALFRYPDFYKVGVAQSGNHDNRNYEDDWGERYIGLLKGDNYEKQANQIYAKNLRGRLLLAHGGMDDNVPPYNTYLVVDALIKANKDFDLLIFPNARHGYGADNFYMMRRRWDYFVRHLLGADPPKEYEIRPVQDPRVSLQN